MVGGVTWRGGRGVAWRGVGAWGRGGVAGLESTFLVHRPGPTSRQAVRGAGPHRGVVAGRLVPAAERGYESEANRAARSPLILADACLNGVFAGALAKTQ
jgi:hypothetical protein